MHELSIAQTVYEVAIENLEEHPNCFIHRIGMRIGKLSDVVPEALQFGFDAIKQDTVLAKTELLIETVAVTGQCRSCHSRFTVEDFRFTCPACDSIQIKVLEGEELEISYLELDDQPDNGDENHRETLTANEKG